MRIVYVGAVHFSLHCLEQVLETGGDVVAVLTLGPENSHGDYADLRPLASERLLPVYQIGNINDPETVELVRSLAPDVIFVFGWSQLIGPDLLSIAPCIGSHPALLPGNRGRHPITWVLVDGLERSGLTFFWLDEGADSGDILWQQPFPISVEDNAGTVYRKVEDLATGAIRTFLPQLQDGTAPRIPQDHTWSVYRRKRTDEDRWIHWRLPARTVHDLVRGLSRPYIGALTRRNDLELRIWETRLAHGKARITPGTVITETEDGVLVMAGDRYLEIVDYEPAGTLRTGDVLR